jgi:hypothetical protein
MGETIAANGSGGIDASRELGSSLAPVDGSVLALMRLGEHFATLVRCLFAV